MILLFMEISWCHLVFTGAMMKNTMVPWSYLPGSHSIKKRNHVSFDDIYIDKWAERKRHPHNNKKQPTRRNKKRLLRGIQPFLLWSAWVKAYMVSSHAWWEWGIAPCTDNGCQVLGGRSPQADSCHVQELHVELL
jgi:hypothetical protein